MTYPAVDMTPLGYLLSNTLRMTMSRRSITNPKTIKYLVGRL